jgi:hypothetical protein
LGGHASNAPASLLAYADYVNLGQGFEIFRDAKKVSDIPTLPYIVSKDKREGVYSHYIDWKIVPIVQISKYSYSYLESVGCRNKCRFCLTSWLNKHQVNPLETRLKRILKRAETSKNIKQFYCIGNNYGRDYGKLNVVDVTIKGYLQDHKKYDNKRLIRVGLESVVKKTREVLGKGMIRDEDIRQFINLTKHYKKRCNIFLIAGLDTQEQWENFVNILPKDFDSSPRLNFIVNYFDPSVGTPLYKYNLSKLIPLNLQKIRRLWKLHNGRVVIFNDGSLSWKNNAIHTLLQRVDETKVEKVLKLQNLKYETYGSMIDVFYKNGLEKETNGDFDYSIKLNNWHGKRYY